MQTQVDELISEAESMFCRHFPSARDIRTLREWAFASGIPEECSEGLLIVCFSLSRAVSIYGVSREDAVAYTIAALHTNDEAMAEIESVYSDKASDCLAFAAVGLDAIQAREISTMVLVELVKRLLGSESLMM